MNKVDLTSEVAKTANLSQQMARQVVDALLDNMGELLAKGDSITFTGLGAFEVRSRKPRKGRNPQTGQSVTVGPFRLVHFKASRKLKERLNG